MVCRFSEAFSDTQNNTDQRIRANITMRRSHGVSGERGSSSNEKGKAGRGKKGRSDQSEKGWVVR